MNDVRVRFCPSPTGSPHVGFARAALYNYAFARHHGGTFVFRIEDTDKQRSTEESYSGMLGAMRWLGLDWDEGPEVGGPYAPYRQSERGDLYREVLAALAESSHTYDCFCTTEEVDARRKASGSKMQGYDGHCRDLTAARRTAFEDEGRKPIVRFRMPDGAITWTDLVRGEVTFETEFVPDFALCRANGDPLYTLVNPVDDALMRITHVLRGEDLLSSTPRQIPLHRALVDLGYAQQVPQFGHLPLIMGEGNRKLSKRDPQAHLFMYRDQGFLPEGLLNYLALLGWAIAPDRDVFTLEEMVEAFDIADVNPNPARFDLKKAEAINADHLRMLSLEDLTHRVLPFLKQAQVVGDPVHDSDAQLLEQAMPLIAERMNKLTEAVSMLGFLFADEEHFTRNPDDVAKLLDEQGVEVVRAAREALTDLHTWSTAEIEQALRSALIDELGLKPRVAFGPVRVAVTGSRISPPLFESMELLGRDRSLARLELVVSSTGPAAPPPTARPEPGRMVRWPVEYHTLLTTARRSPWLGMLGAPLALILSFLIAPALMVGVFVVVFLVTGAPLDTSIDRTLDLNDVTPSTLAYLNLSLASAIPMCWLVMRALHGMRPGWLTSVMPRMRWRWFATCLALSVVALAATLVVAIILPEDGTGAMAGDPNAWTARTRDFVLVIVLLTPLQAAGEEYLFRGYLAQAVGSMADTTVGRTLSRTLAVGVPALLFAMLHGAGQSVPVFFDRFAFGVVAGVLVLVTGGLEAGIAMHVLNNFLAYGLALTFGDMSSALNPTESSWWMVPTTLTQSLVYLGVVWWVARRQGVQRVANPRVLAGSQGLVYRSAPAPADDSGRGV